MKQQYAEELAQLSSGRLSYDQGVLHLAPAAQWLKPLFGKSFFSLFAVAALFIGILLLSISMGSGEALHLGLALILFLAAVWFGARPFIRRDIDLEGQMIITKLFRFNLRLSNFESIDRILLTQVAILGIPMGKSVALVVDGKEVGILGLSNQDTHAEQIVKALSGLVY